jgi:hypothetical protein
MRKTKLFTMAAALTLVCIGGWAASNTQAWVVAQGLALTPGKSR